MYQVLPYKLWIGHAGEGSDSRMVFDTGIHALVQLAAEEPTAAPPRELLFCHFPIVDGPGNRVEQLFLAITTLATLLKTQVPTLVFCGGGMSRSPAVAAAALALVENACPEKCLERVAAHHPIDVSPGLWHEVKSTIENMRGQ